MRWFVRDLENTLVDLADGRARARFHRAYTHTHAHTYTHVHAHKIYIHIYVYMHQHIQSHASCHVILYVMPDAACFVLYQ